MFILRNYQILTSDGEVNTAKVTSIGTVPGRDL